MTNLNTITAKNTIKTLVSAIEKNGMDGLINTATSLYADDVRQRLHHTDFHVRTDRATRPLISLDEAIYYSSTFTQEHFDRFSHVLSHLGTHMIFAKELTVVDYGCGQGLATLALLDYLHKNNCIANKVIHVHLIEPSAITLVLARQYVLAMAKHVNIKVHITVHQQTLAEYLEQPLHFHADTTILHLLSNIVDITSLQSDLFTLSKQINASAGEHFICAVSSYDRGFGRLRFGLTRFAVAQECFSVQSYRFNSNRCIWQDKTANGSSLYAKIA